MYILYAFNNYHAIYDLCIQHAIYDCILCMASCSTICASCCFMLLKLDLLLKFYKAYVCVVLCHEAIHSAYALIDYSCNSETDLSIKAFAFLYFIRLDFIFIDQGIEYKICEMNTLKNYEYTTRT